MAKKTLSDKKLGAEFADKIEIRKFGDLARLTDEEMKALAGRMRGGMGLVYALSADDAETEAVRARVLNALPEMERECLEVNLKYSNPVLGFRSEVLGAARRLPEEGAIRPAPDAFEGERTLPKGRVDVERFADIAKLTDCEIQRVLLHPFTHLEPLINMFVHLFF